MQSVGVAVVEGGDRLAVGVGKDIGTMDLRDIGEVRAELGNRSWDGMRETRGAEELARKEGVSGDSLPSLITCFESWFECLRFSSLYGPVTPSRGRAYTPYSIIHPNLTVLTFQPAFLI